MAQTTSIFDGNPDKWLQVHNLFGSDNLIALMEHIMHRLIPILRLSPTADDIETWKTGKYDLKQVDSTAMWSLPIQADVCAPHSSAKRCLDRRLVAHLRLFHYIGYFTLLPFELFIGLRYTRAKRRNHFISFISLISILGMALGVMALIVVLSVMNGFQKEIRARMLGASPHMEVVADGGRMNGWQSVLDKVAQHPQVSAAAPYIAGQGMLSFGQSVQGIMVRGIDPTRETSITELSDKMKAGALSDLRGGEFSIVLGSDLARALGVRIGDKAMLITPQGQITPAGMVPRLKQFRVAGIFEIGMAPYDNNLALIHINDAQKLFQLGDAVTGISAKLRNIDLAPRIAQELQSQLPKEIYANDWTHQNSNYFRAVQMEKKMMFIILSLIVAVAAFNIVSTLVMAVTDKQADIAILRTLGASPRSIMKIFIVQGVVIGIIGMLLGSSSGIVLSLNLDVVVPFIERLLGVQFLAKDVYYISELPSDLRYDEVLLVSGISFMISLLATLYPSYRASQTQPAEALRYE